MTLESHAVAQTCNFCTWEAEAGALPVLNQFSVDLPFFFFYKSVPSCLFNTLQCPEKLLAPGFVEGIALPNLNKMGSPRRVLVSDPQNPAFHP